MSYTSAGTGSPDPRRDISSHFSEKGINASRASSGNGKDGPARFARACVRCRQQKLACKPGKSGTYPCARCEDGSSECVLVEKQRPVPVPTLSSKISRQEASLSDLAGQLHDIQAHLAQLSDLPARLTALERRYNALAGASQVDHGSGSGSYDYPPTLGPPTGSATSNDRYTSTLLQTPSSFTRRPESSTRERERELDLDVPRDEDVVHEFVSGDLTSTRVLSDVRVYRRSDSARPGKRKRVEEERDAWRIAFTIFTVRCLPSVYFFDPHQTPFTPETVRENSPLLFWAVVATGSRETPELHETFLDAHENTMQLLRQTLGGPRASYWDLCGAMVWNKWLAPVRPIGHIVDLAYELDIHRTYEMLPDKANPSEEDVKKIRLWISVTIQDYYCSVSTGRPPHFPQRSRVFESARWLVSLPQVAGNDYRILATYEYEEIAHSIQDETSRTGILSNDWETQVESRVAAIDDWFARWEPIALTKLDPDELNSLWKALKVNRHLAKTSVYSIVLRGIRSRGDLTDKKLRYIGLSVAEARANCQLCASDFQAPAIQYLGEGMIHALVSAAVFLLKVIWLLPSTYDTPTLFTEVEAVIETFKAVSGQLHAHFLAQILKHVRGHYEDGRGRSSAAGGGNTQGFVSSGGAGNGGNGIHGISSVRGRVGGSNLEDGLSGEGDFGGLAFDVGQGGMIFNPFETTMGMTTLASTALASVGVGTGAGSVGPGTPGADVAGAFNGANGGIGGDSGHIGGSTAGPMMAGLESLGADPTFWSWLAGEENTGFEPLVSTLDTFDQSIAMGGI